MRVLIVFANVYWVYGQIVEAICKFNTDIEFIYIDANLLQAEPETFKRLVEQVDVIHWISNIGNNINTELATWSLQQRPSVASIYHVVPNEEHKVKLANLANLIHVISDEWREYLVTEADIAEEKIELVPLGIHLQSFPYHGAYKPQKPFLIGCFGNINSGQSDRKGKDIVYKLAQLLKQNQLDFKFIVTGRNWQSLTEQLETRYIKNYDYVLGKRLPQLYRTLGAYLIPSRYEGGPMTLLEALATGVPVISTSVGMSRDILKNEENGFIVEKDNAEQVVHCIARLIQESDLGNEIAERGRETVANYDWELIAPRYGAMYKRLAGSHVIQPRKERVEFRGQLMSAMEQRSQLLFEKHTGWAIRLLNERKLLTAYQYVLTMVDRKHLPSALGRLMISTLNLTKYTKT